MDDASAINCKLDEFETEIDGIEYIQLSQSYPRGLNRKSRGSDLHKTVRIADTVAHHRQSRVRCRVPSSRRLLVFLRIN